MRSSHYEQSTAQHRCDTIMNILLLLHYCSKVYQKGHSLKQLHKLKHSGLVIDNALTVVTVFTESCFSHFSVHRTLFATRSESSWLLYFEGRVFDEFFSCNVFLCLKYYKPNAIQHCCIWVMLQAVFQSSLRQISQRTQSGPPYYRFFFPFFLCELWWLCYRSPNIFPVTHVQYRVSCQFHHFASAKS